MLCHGEFMLSVIQAGESPLFFRVLIKLIICFSGNPVSHCLVLLNKNISHYRICFCEQRSVMFPFKSKSDIAPAVIKTP